MKKVLYIDMDEVVANFKERMIELFPFTEHIFNEEESYENGVIIEDCMMKTPRMFRDLEPIEGAVDSVKRLSEHFEIYFLSTPFWEVPESFMDKRHWLEEHFGDMCYKRLILSHRKDLNMGAYLVDDRLANGSEDFTGEHIHFDTAEFPNWKVVEEYLMRKEQINGKQIISVGDMEIENIKLDGFNYKIKHIKFNLNKLDCDGRCNEYCDKAYIIKDEHGIRVREISYFNDDNNEEDSFNRRNYSEDVFIILSHGDESWEIDSFYEIIWTDNKTGVIDTDYDVSEVLGDLIVKSKCDDNL